MSGTTRLAHETFDCMLPGPPSRNNGGSSDCSTSGLFAYGAGSSVSIIQTRSMQLLTVLPMPAPSTTTTSSSSTTISLAPFVTSVRWTPQPLRRDILTHEPSNSHLILAVGDRQGRNALWDICLKLVLLWMDFDPLYKLGIQDLCWIRAKHDSWILASLNSPSLLSLWNTSTGSCFWKYDASPEYFYCIRRDPFDFRHFCMLGLKGVLGDQEDDVVTKERQIVINDSSSELQKLERETTINSSSLASAAFPQYMVKFCFSPHWKHILFVTFPRELVL